MEQSTVDVKSKEIGERAEIAHPNSKEEVENDDEERPIGGVRGKPTNPKAK